MKTGSALSVLAVVVMACCSPSVLALDPSLEVSQYGHSAWNVRDGLFKGNIYAIAQTPDGYLWLGTEFGLVRFDGVRSVPWQPPAGQHLPDNNINTLLAARDGTLWIGTFNGLATLSGGKLTRRPELDGRIVESLLEDREGTVWAGALFSSTAGATGLLCAMRSGSAQCYGKEGEFGIAVPDLEEDSSGNLWVLGASGLWRWKPGRPTRYPTTPLRVSALSRADDGRPLIAVYGAGLMQLARDKVESYPIRGAINPNTLLQDRDVNANKLLRDRDGGLWIGTVERGLIHVHQGRTDIFTRLDGLSGNVVLSVFEDREGNVWVATTGGLDRFRDLPVTTVSAKQGLSSDASQAVLAATDGSIWIGSYSGLTRWKSGQTTVFHRSSGLPDDKLQSLFQDGRGRVWASTGGPAFFDHGLAYFKEGRFVAVSADRGGRVHFITGDEAGNLWLSETHGLVHLLEGRLVEQMPWSELGGHDSAEVLLSGGEQGGVWLGFWTGGGVFYFKDGRLRASYTAADGLGEGHVADLQFDREGALWAATTGGLSRIKNGHIATLTTRNGLPCDTIHWSIEDDDRSLWLYTTCGLVRITRSELEAWIADPERRVEMTVWDAADGVRLRSGAASEYGPRVARATDGRLWFVTGEGVQVVDPHHLAFNNLPPPVHIQQVTADDKTLDPSNGMHLPALVRDVTFDFTALSLVAPENNHYRYKLEGWDRGWREAINELRVEYSNLPPKQYRFRVIACNNSGVWNEEGASLAFVIPPAWYQTNWFRALCAAVFLGLLWTAYRFRVWQLHHQFEMMLEARVGERTRIARDLHDTLLQSFHGLVFRFQAARNMLPNRPEEATQALDTALIRAEQALDESRHSIQGLRPSLSAENDIDQVLITTGQELASSNHAEDGSPRFEVIVEGERRDLPPMIKDEVARIARELLRNAFRHARAHEIEVEIRYENDVFRLIVRDDGKGVDPKIIKDGGRAGHWGLPGIQERARGIGARLEFWSEAGAGTEIRLTLPADIAYERPQSGDRFSLFRKRRTHEPQS